MRYIIIMSELERKTRSIGRGGRSRLELLADTWIDDGLIYTFVESPFIVYQLCHGTLFVKWIC
jgi:hypothetical protein